MMPLLAVMLTALAQDTVPDVIDDATEAAEAAPEVYSFSAESGRVAALVFESPDTEASGRSHHHVVVARSWSGRLRWAEGEQCAGEFKVDLGSLDADAPEERKAEGFDRPMVAQDRAAVNEHLRARDQLFIERFPTLTYTVASCDSDDDGRVVIKGALSLRGISKTVGFRVVATERDGSLELQGEGSITHTAFGFEPYYALFGQRQNQDRMTLKVAVQGTAVGPNASLAAPITGG